MNRLLTLTLALLPLSLAADSPGPAADPAIVSPAIEIESVPTAPLPGSFAIDYELRFGALRATLKLRLDETDENNSYRISATTKARGLARLFMARELLEQSEFRFTDSRVLPALYQLDSGKKSGEDTGSIVFDWETLTAASVHEGEPAELLLDEDIYDRISADVVVIMDLRNGRSPRDMRIAEKNQLREYTYTYETEERIDTPAGSFDTVRYLRQRTGSSRSTRIWYARDAGYLPVQMEQLKNGKPAAATQAKSVVLNGTAE